MPRLLLLLLTLTACTRSEPSASPITILTASSAADAITDAAALFKDAKVTVVPGGSNTLANQVLAGAPADLFLSANAKWADAVTQKLPGARRVNLLTNDLVLIVPAQNPAHITRPADLLLPAVKRIALAGETVPAGLYAQQALTSLKLYDPLLQSGRLVRGHDVRMTLSYVQRGEADAGIVYSTDARASDQVRIVATFDPATFEPIVYPLVLLESASRSPAAQKFFDFLQSKEADAAFERRGFRRAAR
jgi:molybdate transport system substrate-binding protein